MEHKCDCTCCREHRAISRETKGAPLFPGAWFFELPAASAAAANAEGELMVYACRRGSLCFCAESGASQSLHAGELAVWKAADFLSGTIEPDESFAGFCLRFDLKKLTEQPPESLLGADVTGERLYDRYCARETMTCVSADDALHGILDAFYGQNEKTALSWRRLGAQALLLWLGQQGFSAQSLQDAPEDSSEQVRIVHEVHAFLTQNLDTRVTIEELSHQYLMNPTTLKQVFKSVYGTSLAAHMKEHRMGRAAQLLRETDAPVAEIARAVGYESQSKFTETFKAYFGKLPREYRKNH